VTKSQVWAILAALLALIAVHVGSSAAATNGSGASSSEALRGGVVIQCTGQLRTQPARPPHGRCVITGAITDRGKFVDDDVLRHNPHVRTFFGAKGTIRISVYRERRGHWRIIEGTKAYSGLRGRGWESSTGPCPTRFGCAISLTMTGTVSSDASGAGATQALQGKVRIHLEGTLTGPQFAAIGRGRFTLSGAISDRGAFVDRHPGIHPPNDPYVRTLSGTKGTIRIACDGEDNWRIIQGTKAYAGLRGRGTLQGRYRFTGIDATMIGTVSP